MPRYDYAAQIARLGIKRNQASTVPGVDARTERRYAANPDRVPPVVRRLLFACERHQDLLKVFTRLGA